MPGIFTHHGQAARVPLTGLDVCTAAQQQRAGPLTALTVVVRQQSPRRMPCMLLSMPAEEVATNMS